MSHGEMAEGGGNQRTAGNATGGGGTVGVGGAAAGSGAGTEPGVRRRVFVLLKVAPCPAEVYFSSSRGTVEAAAALREIGYCDRSALEAAARLAAGAGGMAGGEPAEEAAGASGRPGPGVEVVALGWAPEADEPVLRSALAAGAERLVRITTALGPEAADPLVVARGLASALSTRDPWLVLCGAESPDESRGAVGPMVAALLGWPFVGAVAGLAWGEAGGTAGGACAGGTSPARAAAAGGSAGGTSTAGTLDVESRERAGAVTWRVRPPAVLALGRHGPQPRTPSPVQLAKAFRQPVERVEVEAPPPALKVRSLATTESRRRLNEPIPGSPGEALAMLWAKLRERRVV